MSYTKHYYIGSERISAKTGTCVDIGTYNETFIATKMPQLDEELVREPSDIRVGFAAEIASVIHAKFELQPPAFSSVEDPDSNSFNHLLDQLDYFYFHPDHLGSSSYITNAAGTVSQHMEYLPFGETLVDEHTNSYNSPFKYNGKEFDEETGNYYYSARYYDPKLSIFISVDPLAEQAPDWTPYRYGFNNPIKYTDPTGMFENDDWYENASTGKLEWRNNQDAVINDSRGSWNNIGEELLTFDGKNLTYYTQEKLSDGNLKLNSTSFSAVSGREQKDGTFDYSKQAQATPFSGPLPEGDYSVNPSAIQWWTDQSFGTRTGALLSFIGVKKGTWPGGIISWGVARTWISPQEVNVTNPTTGESVLRNNFSIHGGSSRGSAGCIDLTSKDLPFFRMLEKSTESKIRLRVNY